MAILSVASIVFLVLFIIFLILTAVFIGLYIRARNLYTTCQVSLTGFTCPSCPICPVCPTGNTGNTGSTGNTGNTGSTGQHCNLRDGNVVSFATGTIKGQKVEMSCPVGSVIGDYQVYTTVVDTKNSCPPTDISDYVKATGLNNYSVSSASLLREANIDSQIAYDRRNKIYPTRVVYGTYVCQGSNNDYVTPSWDNSVCARPSMPYFSTSISET
jgi:hypothetical protein